MRRSFSTVIVSTGTYQIDSGEKIAPTEYVRASPMTGLELRREAIKVRGDKATL